jgi:hypothetical protein
VEGAATTADAASATPKFLTAFAAAARGPRRCSSSAAEARGVAETARRDERRREGAEAPREAALPAKELTMEADMMRDVA